MSAFRILAILLAVHLAGGAAASAQQKPPPAQPLHAVSALLLYPSGATRIVETFAVIQQANQGIPAAQHELAYRYIVGRGIPADSVKGAQWMLRAAQNGMALAQFNAGILYTHAIGVPWDPFKAYRWFKAAAQQGLPAGQFIYGILHADGLVIPPDYARAYQLVLEAYEQGFDDAKEVLEEFRRHGFDTLKIVSASTSAPEDSASNLVMLHFDDARDPTVDDSILVKELERELGHPLTDSSASALPWTQASADSALARLRHEAKKGIPEAHMVLGRIFEKGIGVQADPIRAAVQYLRANRLDSPRAPAAIVNLIGKDIFRTELLKRAQRGDADARFVWASLSALELDNVIGREQALRFLTEQSEGTKAHAHSCIELGFWYASGRNVPPDPRKAIMLWERADSLGEAEGHTRAELARLVLMRQAEEPRTTYFRQQAEEGSILAQAAYAYCLRAGIGTAVNIPEAASWYRKAAQRGSQSAYYGLKGMYDELRPGGEEFRIE